MRAVPEVSIHAPTPPPLFPSARGLGEGHHDIAYILGREAPQMKVCSAQNFVYPVRSIPLKAAQNMAVHI
jgi:hypothetical protein